MINHLFKEYTGWGIFRQDLLRPSFRVMRELWGDSRLTGVEIGVFKGIHAKQILKHFSMEKLYLVDIKKIIDFKEPNVEFIVENSLTALNKIPNNLDFIYIDGDHSYNQVIQELNLCYPKLKKGGVLAGHDINMSGVLQAVCEFVSQNKLKVYAKCQDFWIIK